MGAVLWSAAAAWLYGPVAAGLARTWASDPTYSHGFFIAPVALALAWRQRRALRSARREPNALGLMVVIAAMGLYAAGTLAAELYTTRVSGIVLIAGTLLFVAGRAPLRVLAFPLGFLLLMIPIPAILFDRIAVSLQLASSSLGERLLQSIGVPVLRDGNLLTLANARLEVADACSGIRSLVSLVAVALLLGHLTGASVRRQTLVALAMLPAAVALNAVRLALTAVVVSHVGPWAATGVLHEISGWLVFVVALACMWLGHASFSQRAPWTPRACHSG